MFAYFKILIIFIIITLTHPYLFIILFKKNFKKNLKIQNKSLIKEYENKGFTSIELSKKDLKYIFFYKKIISKIIFLNKFLFKNILIDKKYYFYTNNDIIKHQLFFPNIENILKENLNQLLEDILGKDFKIVSFLWQRNMFFPDSYSEELYSNFWHYDFKRMPNRWCRVMIYLTKQGEAESIQLFDLKTSKFALKNKLYGRYPQNKLPDLIKNKKYYSSPGLEGTVKIINTADLLHRAGHLPKGKIRDVFFIIMQSKLKWKDNPEFLFPPEKK